MTPAISQAAQPAAFTMPAAEPAKSQHAPTSDVGQPLTAESREEAIQRAGELMLRRYADFARTGDLADLGDAHRAMLNMKALIAGRSREQVRRMEIRKGLI